MELWSSCLLLRGLVKLNRRARSLKLYVVADTHARYPPYPVYIFTRKSLNSRKSGCVKEKKRGRTEPHRAFRIKTFVSTGLFLAATLL